MNQSVKKRPNVIMIMTDDQGYGDLSCMGSTDFVTPNIDSLASEGALFKSMYAGSPVCSPSRASLLTGRYPGNAGVRAILAGHRKATGLTKETPTIAAALKESGYSTALIGKWHLGLKEGCRPWDNGFDYFYGFMAGCIDYYSHIFYYGMSDGGCDPTHDLWENDREVYQNGEYFTEMATRKTVKYIREHASDTDPFMIYLGYNAPHYPMHAPQEYMDRFAHLPWDRQVMAAMIAAVDDGIGDIVNELKRQGIYEDTIIYFQSDNGPSRESRNFMDGCGDPYYGGQTGGFKGHKFSLFEGGIRVPALISYPAGIKRNQIIEEPVAAMDLFPTLLNLAGGDAAEYTLDGSDLTTLLTTGADHVHDQIFWEMEGQTAVREGNYKLVLNGQLVESEAPQDEIFLSDLAGDPGETHNIAGQYPEITERLKNAAISWRENLERNWDEKFAGRYKSLT
ncbi:sulfatase family protein [Ruminococcus gauvreauii]|uniref:Sulfatase-like hydrolase/transferase n=1 Tax=Ruminococcus gauvreauii TaxID=438033 RepID=A0ABY5VKH8_9FIRM|nr:sulfatase-like hydrolase/transferase [Ruminococcus gauvreauii]UWP60802.1 sulfatase-like hydrolase/transferase [Ruminococcus gauvreauii]